MGACRQLFPLPLRCLVQRPHAAGSWRPAEGRTGRRKRVDVHGRRFRSRAADGPSRQGRLARNLCQRRPSHGEVCQGDDLTDWQVADELACRHKDGVAQRRPTGGTPGSPFRTARQLIFMGDPVVYEVPLLPGAATAAPALLNRAAVSPPSGTAARQQGSAGDGHVDHHRRLRPDGLDHGRCPAAEIVDCSATQRHACGCLRRAGRQAKD